jgi:hypothetical protein
MTKAYALLAAGFLLLGAAACQAGDRKIISVQVIPDETMSTPGTPVQVIPAEMSNTAGTPVEVLPAEMADTSGTPVEIIPAEMTSTAGTPVQAAPHELTCTTGTCGCEGADHRSHWEALHEWLTYHHQRCTGCNHCRCAPCCTPPLYLYFLCRDGCGHGSYGCASCAGNGAMIGSSDLVHPSGTPPATITTVAVPEAANDSPYPVVPSETAPAQRGQAMYVASPQQLNRLYSSGLPAGTVIMAVGPDGRPVKESAVTLGR